MYGNDKGKKVFSIPVEWVVTETLDIRANNLQEAVEFIVDHLDIIPLGTEPVYIDGSYKISADDTGEYDINAISTALHRYGSYTERNVDERFDKVDVLD